MNAYLSLDPANTQVGPQDAMVQDGARPPEAGAQAVCELINGAELVPMGPDVSPAVGPVARCPLIDSIGTAA